MVTKQDSEPVLTEQMIRNLAAEMKDVSYDDIMRAGGIASGEFRWAILTAVSRKMRGPYQADDTDDLDAIDFDDAYPSYAEALDSPPLTDEQKRSAFKKAMEKNG